VATIEKINRPCSKDFDLEVTQYEPHDPSCGVEMAIVSVITDPVVVDAILRHVGRGRGHDPHEARAPPAA
jgi:hypothetical protein